VRGATAASTRRAVDEVEHVEETRWIRGALLTAFLAAFGRAVAVRI
jgi:hypothetical protein